MKHLHSHASFYRTTKAINTKYLLILFLISYLLFEMCSHTIHMYILMNICEKKLIKAIHNMRTWESSLNQNVNSDSNLPCTGP